MLRELTIENFAIIDRLMVQFFPGLTVLTGETGAGKSIIIDALHAALGARVGADVIRSSARQASVEAIFDMPVADRDSALHVLLGEYGVDADDELILRREVSASGRSSARLNGRAVPASAIAAIGGLLVDIHGQTDHLSILRRDRQLDALDRYGGLLDDRNCVREAVRRYNGARRALADLVGGQREAEQRLDLLRFQVNEIESADLHPGEDEELGAERTRLANAERLTGLSESAYGDLAGEGRSAGDALAAALHAVRELAAIDPSLDALHERLQAAVYDIDDIAQEVRHYRDGVDHDPLRLEAVEERLDLIARLKRKYGATVEEILDFGREARASLEDVENLDDRIASLQREVEEAAAAAGTVAEDLSRRRRDVAAELDAAMAAALQGLGLKGTAFRADVSQIEDPDGLLLPSAGGRYAVSATGLDTVSFLVSFNPGEPLRPLEKVASGGETSRFLLALKSVLAEADRTPTLVFDEVDVGVGARNGMVVGERLRDLARAHQVLSITHLPQIAALADQHIIVAKDVQGDRTAVAVRALDKGDRVVELAAMMGGTGTETARRTAEELLEAARRGE